ncbi:complex I NDUFA9 subunit family protein [Sphingomonas sp. BN140010]|uniref:Complex I NDUFA9 subunit family protein n=1 Tax=Sphingomonas arvum TaxID=2992113 RepID=A0ABT3JBH5_9SPHN|nr:complex I NDUFA9 subunit family protein [Sphingomonas sp. BN140010]MCW3796412.1 complex I NDUFA9 subunit family protein [Sphingomonas sp. BN140010]
MTDPASDWRNRIITVLGGGGFIGRYVCEQLFHSGVRLRVAQRNPRKAWFLQPLAAVGQLDLVPIDMNKPGSLERAIDGAWGVVNLVGAFSGNLQQVHADSAGRAAELAARTGAESFVHVSAINADPDSPSVYGSTKGRGEQAVRAAFPNATIVRPSLVFGPEDQLTNRFANMARLPILPVLAPTRRFQPVYVRDLAEAIAEAAQDPEEHGGETYEIGGPEVMTMHELNARIAEAAGHSPGIVDLPDFVGAAMSKLGFLPGAPLTRDQWLMLANDNVVHDGMPGLEAFGITPTPLDVVAPDWLDRFQPGGRFQRNHRRSQASAG